MILEVKNLTKYYGAEKAVDNISFSVKAGEIVGLLGPNGAGKTSTISMILGLLSPTSGSVKIFGEDIIKNRSKVLEKVNFAATYAQLPGNLSTWQNLFIFAMLYGISAPREKVEEVIDEFDLERFRDTRASFLSSGEQSRLSLAKAVLNSPKLLLLDEPTASIDPSTANIIRNRIKDYVKDTGAAILLTSHNMYEVEEVCDNVLFISHGKLLLAGDPRELPARHGKRNLEELFITVAREPLSLNVEK